MTRKDYARGVRKRFGPVEVYAYHDYSTTPWASPLYVGLHVYRPGQEGGLAPFSREVLIPSSSALRPFSWGADA